MNKNKIDCLRVALLISFTAFYIVSCVSPSVERPSKKLSHDQTVAIMPFINCSDGPVSKNQESKKDKMVNQFNIEELLTDALLPEKVNGLKLLSWLSTALLKV